MSSPVNSQMNAYFPHSGYHWRGQSFAQSFTRSFTRSSGQSADRFFEGWYFRLTLPDPGQTFAFMYSIDDPAGGSDYSGGAAQILGPNEAYYCRSFPDAAQFWAWPHRLGLGHWRSARASSRSRYLSPERFEREVVEGYQVSDRLHQGKLLAPSGQIKAQWHYTIDPIDRWGGKCDRATAGWLSYLPIFEPGWQVLMAHGLATGWIEWYDDGETQKNSTPTRYAFENAPAYAEKNWGGAFPAKWFWIQCNAFKGEPTLSITAVAGVREVLMFTENVGLIGIHHQGKFYEFFSTKTAFTWRVDPWGYWQVTARSFSHRVVLTGQATDAGALVRVPTRQGLQFLCRDTTHGELRLQLWAYQREASGTQKERLVIDATSQLAGLEVGGGPWNERWTNMS
ncbi:MAG: tocopherol cyclase family protein [Phormidesmis sp.]